MAHKVTDSCAGCGTCVDACPVGAINADSGVAVIDADVCVDCGACEDACPCGAIEA